MTLPLRLPGAAVGNPMTRVDGPLKVTGAAHYAADNPVPDFVHAVLVCSNVSAGRVDRIDSAAAARYPGVLSVLSDFGGLKLPYDIRRVSFFGQPVAVVVAESLEAASHGAELVDVRFGVEAQNTNIDAPQSVPVPAKRQVDYARGDPEGALRTSSVVVDGRYSIARNDHNPMEMPSTVATWDGDRLTVWDKVQSIVGAQEAQAEAHGVPVGNVRVISPFVGGAFGSAGQVWPHQLLAAFAARKLGKPVKLVLTREQTYAGVGYRPTSRQRLAIGADGTGRINAVVHEGRTETARYASYEDGLTAPPRFMYASPNMRSTYRVVPLDVNQPTYMRGPGFTTGTFALESAMDDLAHRIGVDPIELRLRNEPDHDQTDGLPFSTRRLPECLRRGADEFGWGRRNSTPRAVHEGDQLIGIGMAAAGYHTSRSESDALARINADGTADVQTATSDMGPGTYTSMTQVAADALGLSADRVRFGRCRAR